MMFTLCILAYLMFSSLSFFFLVRAVWRMERMLKEVFVDE